MPNTPNHNWPLPTVGASADAWGGIINDGFGFVDALTSGAQNTFLGRITSGAGPYTQLTAAQVTNALPAVVGDAGAGGTKGLVPAPATGDGAAKKYLQADGTWGNELKAQGAFNGANGATISARGVTVTRNSTGNYLANLSPAMADTNYRIFLSLRSGPGFMYVIAATATKTTSQFSFLASDLTGTFVDPTEIYIAVVG